MKTVEATYPSETYIHTTKTEGVDVYIDTDKDAKFTLRASYCPRGKDPADPDNYYPLNIPVTSGQSVNKKLAMSMGPRGIRQAVRIFIDCTDDSANYTVTCENC